MGRDKVLISDFVGNTYRHPQDVLGSTTIETKTVSYLDLATGEVKTKDITMIEVLFKLIDEILTNAADNLNYDKLQDTIKVDYVDDINSPSWGTFTIMNNGEGFSTVLVKTSENNILKRDTRNPEIAFTQEFSSTNYVADKRSGGSYGIGAKVVTYLSECFCIDILDSKRSTSYKQRFEMDQKRIEKRITNVNKSFLTIYPPKIVVRKSKPKIGYTQVRFKPLYEVIMYFNTHKFSKLSNVTKRSINKAVHYYLSQRMIDIHMYYGKRLKHLVLNGLDINVSGPVKSLTMKQYIALPTISTSTHKPVRVINAKTQKGDDIWEVYALDVEKSPIHPFKQFLIINGVRVEFPEQFIKSFAKYLERKFTTADMHISVSKSTVRKYVRFYGIAHVISPLFDSANKYKLARGSTSLKPADLSTFWERVYRSLKLSTKLRPSQTASSVVKTLKTSVKQDKLKSNEQTKYHIHVANVIANGKARKGIEPILTIAEGASASNFLTDLIKFMGTKTVKSTLLRNTIPLGDLLGVFKLKGKIANVRKDFKKFNTRLKQRKKLVLVELLQTMGFDFSKVNISKKTGKMTDASIKSVYDSLIYKKLMIVTDQDTDGFHIRGLVINAMDVLFPGFVDSPITNGFLWVMITPILKFTGGSKLPRYFFYKQEYDQISISEKRALSRRTKLYLKGLGSSNNEELTEIANHIDRYIKRVVIKEDGGKLLEDIFGSSSDERKSLVDNFYKHEHDHSKAIVKYVKTPIMTIQDYIYNEYLYYSRDSVFRAIPSMWDGFKEVHRMIFYVVRKHFRGKGVKKGLTISGAVISTGYEHGDISLNNAILYSARINIGYNLPIITPTSRNFGRYTGSETAIRYTFYTYSKLMDYLFPPDDDKFLTTDLKGIPTHYVPILPTILLNHMTGMAIGYSTNVLPFSIKNMVKYFIKMLDVSKAQATSVDSFDPSVITNFSNILYTRIGLGLDGFTGDIYTVEDNGKVTYLILSKFIVKGRELTILDYAPMTNRGITVKDDLMVYLDTDDGKKESNKALTFAKYYEPQHSGKHSEFFKTTIVKGFAEFNATATIKSAQLAKTLSDALNRGIDAKFITEHSKTLMEMGLLTEINTSNFNASKDNGQVVDIGSHLTKFIREWSTTRINLYKQRKHYEIDQLNRAIARNEGIVKYINYVSSSRYTKIPKNKAELIKRLESAKLPKIDGTFDYLTSISPLSLTADRVKVLEKDNTRMKKEVDRLSKLYLVDMWKDDLKRFSHAYVEWNKERLRILGSTTI